MGVVRRTILPCASRAIIAIPRCPCAGEPAITHLPMPNDLPFHSLTSLKAHLERGDVSSVEIVEACLERIARLDGRLHAFIDVYRDSALACAEAADLERQAGMPRGPLHGLPVALKDLLHLAGRQTTAGSKSWLGRKSDETATVVERLVAGGMIPLGKTHMVEFAFGGWGRNEPMGTPWNPWDTATHRVPGGSSSGSAVAVAAGLVPAAIGSDTGGSVRIPASLCGLTGLKTTYGLDQPRRRACRCRPRSTRSGRSPTASTTRRSSPPRWPDRIRATPAPATRRTSTSPPRSTRSPTCAACASPVLRPSRFRPARATTSCASSVRPMAALRDLGAIVEETRFPLDFDEPDGAQRTADRGRGLCRASRLHRRSGAAHRSVGQGAHAVGQGDRCRRLHRRARASGGAPRPGSPSGCAAATRC